MPKRKTYMVKRSKAQIVDSETFQPLTSAEAPVKRSGHDSDNYTSSDSKPSQQPPEGSLLDVKSSRPTDKESEKDHFSREEKIKHIPETEANTTPNLTVEDPENVLIDIEYSYPANTDDYNVEYNKFYDDYEQYYEDFSYSSELESPAANESASLQSVENNETLNQKTVDFYDEETDEEDLNDVPVNNTVSTADFEEVEITNETFTETEYEPETNDYHEEAYTEAEEANDRSFYAAEQIVTTSEFLQPDTWIVAFPENSKDAVLNFYQGAEVVCSYPLSEVNLQTLMPVLNKFYVEPDTEPKTPFTKRFKTWFMKHKIIGSLAILLAVIIGFNVIAGLFLNGIY